MGLRGGLACDSMERVAGEAALNPPVLAPSPRPNRPLSMVHLAPDAVESPESVRPNIGLASCQLVWRDERCFTETACGGRDVSSLTSHLELAASRPGLSRGSVAAAAQPTAYSR